MKRHKVGLNLGVFDAGLSPWEGNREVVFKVKCSYQQAALLSDEVTLESTSGEAGVHREHQVPRPLLGRQ